MRIAHIINPVIVDDTSDLKIAQKITFETMKTAKDEVKEEFEVEQYATVFPEDSDIIPEHIRKTSDLELSVLNLNSFRQEKKLPLIKDILNRLYESSNADYFIYTNVDIALMPFFYNSVHKFIKSGYDGFVINRRTIDNKYSDISDIPLMIADIGESHIGHDCFVFKRDIFPRFVLGNLCIGAPFVGRVLIWNVAAFSNNFKEMKHCHLTFHIGKERIWKNPEFDDYTLFNKKEAKKVLDDLTNKYNVYDKINDAGLLTGMNFSGI